MNFTETASKLIDLTRPFLNRPDLIQGPGGNTSVKDEQGNMFIKASGFRFSELTETSGISAVNAKKIADYFRNVEVISKEKCEKESIDLVAENILNDSTGKKFPKPSMETGFHAVLDTYVAHTHSVWTNLVNCSTNGYDLVEQISKELKKAIAYIPFVSPGFGLSYLMTQELKKAEGKSLPKPVLFFLENHGIVAHGNSAKEVVNVLMELDAVIAKLFSCDINSYPSTTLENHGAHFVPAGGFCSTVLKKYSAGHDFFLQTLFPDQTVFFAGNISFDKNQPNKINIASDYSLSYLCGDREATSIHETLTAYLFLYSTLSQGNHKLRLIDGKEVDYINNMDMEKHRKDLMNKSN